MRSIPLSVVSSQLDWSSGGKEVKSLLLAFLWAIWLFEYLTIYIMGPSDAVSISNYNFGMYRIMRPFYQ